ncbi:hypothetical protein MMEU_3347 [Mycobacterium marinum str. Europe]|nr:hypothetical protein MMEU_3347 [Mycobacterium marinum str. Europe]
MPGCRAPGGSTARSNPTRSHRAAARRAVCAAPPGSPRRRRHRSRSSNRRRCCRRPSGLGSRRWSGRCPDRSRSCGAAHLHRTARHLRWRSPRPAEAVAGRAHRLSRRAFRAACGPDGRRTTAQSGRRRADRRLSPATAASAGSG